MAAGAITDLTVIVGAGISKEHPSNAPDFERLRNEFLHACLPELDLGEFKLPDLSPEQVFEALDDDREGTREEIRRALWWLCEPTSPNRNHLALARLIDKGARVWTPNFDTLIERAGAPAVQITPIVSDPEQARTEPRPLLKPHGSFPYPGRPPREPGKHDYELLFRASSVWQLDPTWRLLLEQDCAGRDVHLFGYRGADPDLTPVILAALRGARSATWWEMRGSENVRHLERLLDPASVALRLGNPSQALQELAARYVAVEDAEPEAPLPSAPNDGRLEYRPSCISLSQLSGGFLGAPTARRYLRRALLHDPGADRRNVLLKLLRSLGYDRAWARPPLMLLFSTALRSPGLDAELRRRLAAIYATLLDSRPIRRSDRRKIRRLRRLEGSSPDVAVRIASISKLHGDLATAREEGERALASAGNRPMREAMAVYNLVWIYRQQGEFGVRAELVDRFEDRLPHIGFNWAAWLAIDNALACLHFGDLEGAHRQLESPFMRFARERIGHPAYEQDDSLAGILFAWHRDGAGGIEGRLLAELRKRPVRPLLPPPYSSITTLILLADCCRARGDRDGMERHLRRAGRRAGSPLQQAQIALVSAFAAADSSALAELEALARRRGFGLLADAAQACGARLAGTALPGGALVRPGAPLPGLY